METTLQKQLQEIDDIFDRQELELKDARKKMKKQAWNYNINSGLLKSEL